MLVKQLYKNPHIYEYNIKEFLIKNMGYEVLNQEA